MAIIYGRYVRNITKKVQDSLAGATQVAEERIANIRTVRAFSQEGFENNQYRSKIMEVLHLAEKEALAQGIFFGMVLTLRLLLFFFILVHGGIKN